MAFSRPRAQQEMKGPVTVVTSVFFPLPQTVVLKGIEVHYPQHLQCHPSQTAQMGPDIPDKAGGIERRCI